ncbi:MAG: YicC family protein [Melioribacteraceae bacterium]|jgi:uncharacterized protein (TIGR00255 family)|nr:YicC family protein [Melioribacteraceae bacterium]
MILSMTGYGNGTSVKNDIEIEVEIKSVNSRYLDLSLRLPKFLLNREFEIRELIKKGVRRGKVFLSVSIKKGNIEEKFNEIDPTAVKYALNLLTEIKKAAKIKDKISLQDIMLFQNMIYKDEETQATEEFELVADAIEKAIVQLNQMREAEGTELEKDLRKRIALIQDSLIGIENRSEQSIKDHFEKLKDRAKQIHNDWADNEPRLNMELALLAERSDVTEECVRLRSHIKMFLESLEKSDDAGRRLNFITQEMNREANTINSKTVSSEISHHGIFIKEELEKIREQIQNIE